MKTAEQIKFIMELQQLLGRYKAEMNIEDNGNGFHQRHEIEVLFNGGESGDEFGYINLGNYIDKSTAF